MLQEYGAAKRAAEHLGRVLLAASPEGGQVGPLAAGMARLDVKSHVEKVRQCFLRSTGGICRGHLASSFGRLWCTCAVLSCTKLY